MTKIKTFRTAAGAVNWDSATWPNPSGDDVTQWVFSVPGVGRPLKRPLPRLQFAAMQPRCNGATDVQRTYPNPPCARNRKRTRILLQPADFQIARRLAIRR